MNRLRNSIRIMLAAAFIFGIGAAAKFSLVPLIAPVNSARAANPCNPCAAKRANPCNPCAAKRANPCNPCNPCAAKRANPCNPCNPCAAKRANPCNPCGGSAKGKKGKAIGWGKDYKSYEKVTGYVPSASHGNRLVVTYVAPAGPAETYRFNASLVRRKKTGGFKNYPVGTLIAKESFIKLKSGKPGKKGPVFFMRKEKAGYDPSGGDWRYAFTKPDFSLIGEGKSGNVAFCKACHTTVKSKDFVFAVDR